ncbi:MAG: TetR/AcrR family transcriptional regulator [Pseudonocardia sp.]
MKAEERREQILAAAVVEFGRHGLHGGSTVQIAKTVGMSHPNLFRLFPTKRSLFLAAIDRAVERTSLRMIQKGRESTGDPVVAMRDAWGEAMADHDFMAMFLQGYAACHDDEVRAAMRRVTKEVFTGLESIPGMTADTARNFYARGLFFMIAAAMGFPEQQVDDEWVSHFMGTPPADPLRHL